MLSLGVGVYNKGDVVDLQVRRGGQTQVIRGRRFGEHARLDARQQRERLRAEHEHERRGHERHATTSAIFGPAAAARSRTPSRVSSRCSAACSVSVAASGEPSSSADASA